jgi:hypothetical protein
LAGAVAIRISLRTFTKLSRDTIATAASSLLGSFTTNSSALYDERIEEVELIDRRKDRGVWSGHAKDH